jgi:hypothetical protein
MASFQQRFGQVKADEARSTGDKNSFGHCRFFNPKLALWTRPKFNWHTASAKRVTKVTHTLASNQRVLKL